MSGRPAAIPTTRQLDQEPCFVNPFVLLAPSGFSFLCSLQVRFFKSPFCCCWEIEKSLPFLNRLWKVLIRLRPALSRVESRGFLRRKHKISCGHPLHKKCRRPRKNRKNRIIRIAFVGRQPRVGQCDDLTDLSAPNFSERPLTSGSIVQRNVAAIPHRDSNEDRFIVLIIPELWKKNR